MTSTPPIDLRLLVGAARRPVGRPAQSTETVELLSLPPLGNTIWNPAGASSLAFRPGTYETFLDGMLSRLRLQPEPPDGRPLRNLHLGEPRDWLLGLTEAWAVVGDVLTFYLERIANEGYLRTAVEPFSVWQLLRTIGYAPRPGIAGTANLAFTVAAGRRLPEGVLVPAQLQVRSLPTGNQLPQVYELDTPLQTFASWSAIRPLAAGKTAQPRLRVGATSIALDGTRTGLRAGSGLLIVADGGATRMFRTLSSVAIERTRAANATAPDASTGGGGSGSGGGSLGARGVTVVSWEEPLVRLGGLGLEAGSAALVFANPQAFAFGKRAHLFGYNAIPWDQLPDAAKLAVCPRRGGVNFSDDRGLTFRPENQGLPTTQVLTLAIDSDARLIAGTVQGFYRSTPEGWQAPTSGLGKAPIQALCFGPRGQIFAGTPSGVYRSTDGGNTWSYLAPAALALRRNQDPSKPSLGFAATIGDKLKALGSKLRALVAKILPSLGQTVRPEPRLTGQPVLALAATGDQDSTILFAGTAQGVYRTLASGGGWLPMNQGLPQLDPTTGLADVTIRAFAAGPEPGTIFAATDQGLFRSTDAGQRWRGAGWGYPRAKNGPAAANAVAVATDPRSRQTFVFTATEAGLYRSSDGGDRFTAASSGLPPAAAGTLGASAPARLLAASEDETTLSPLLYAALGDESFPLYRSDDLGDSWRALATPAGGTGSPTISALAAQGRSLAIATPFDGFLCDQWPGYHLSPGQIDLSATVPDLTPQGWAVLTQSRPQPTPFPPLPPRIGAYPIQGVLTVNRDDFGISAQVTRLEVTDDGQLVDFDLRTTEANVASSEIALARLPVLEPLEGSLLQLALPLPEAPGPGRLLSISGRRIRAVLVPTAPPRPLSTDDTPRPPIIGPGDRLIVLRAPESPSSTAGSTGPPGLEDRWSGLSIVWHVETASGVRGRLLARRDELAWQGAGDDDPIIAETVSCLGATAADPDDAATPAPEPAPNDPPDDPAAAVSSAPAAPAAPAEGAPRAALFVSPSLRYLYDPTTVTINANVGTATQGETIPNEVIGSGNANRANQSFTLRAKPLTFVPDPKTGYRSTLEVLVDGVAWRGVPTLYGQGPASRVYAVELDESGAATVTFGDGKYGARLPTGVENVVARYRAGQWSTDQPAAALRLLQSRPFGLREVTNPEPAPGAIPAETSDKARTSGPLAVRTLDRIVALDDYADFSRTFPGIARAVTTVVWNGRSRLIALTVAGKDGAPVPNDSELYQALSAAIQGQRYLARPLAIASYTRVGFSLVARVQPAVDVANDDLKKALRAALLAAFGFDARKFGQGVAGSEVIAVLQSVPGILAIELDKLYFTGSTPQLSEFLPALPAHWDRDKDRLAPAEIVLVDSNGISLILPGDPEETK